LPASAWTEWSQKYDEDQEITSRRGYILRVLDFGCRLNGEFVLSAAGPPASSKPPAEGGTRLGNLVEDYDSALTSPATTRRAARAVRRRLARLKPKGERLRIGFAPEDDVSA
jgi:hypothetical protein